MQDFQVHFKHEDGSVETATFLWTEDEPACFCSILHELLDYVNSLADLVVATARLWLAVDCGAMTRKCWSARQVGAAGDFQAHATQTKHSCDKAALPCGSSAHGCGD